MNVFRYKGFIGSIEVNSEEKCLHGVKRQLSFPASDNYLCRSVAKKICLMALTFLNFRLIHRVHRPTRISSVRVSGLCTCG